MNLNELITWHKQEASNAKLDDRDEDFEFHHEAQQYLADLLFVINELAITSNTGR